MTVSIWHLSGEKTADTVTEATFLLSTKKPPCKKETQEGKKTQMMKMCCKTIAFYRQKK